MARTSYLIAGLVLIVGARVGVAQQVSEDDFKAYQSTMEGRWVGEITWIADWPGLGKKGDKVTGYSSIRAVVDGHALVGQFYGGNGTGRWMTVYDAAAKQIRELGSDSGGTMWNCLISWQDRHWTSHCTGSLADGTKTEGDWTLNVSDDGDTHRWTGSVSVGGEASDPLQDVWTRVGR